ncbi:MAG: hypothetical protein AVDCRST_MAG76-2885 [uncultured Acidimicrobiales bacterium]|uniref:Uncharacterized protein n=1 Tax=uncultured Acidimicrobiales bacterium TaxID=310071 RepID=A0A6J4IXH5_9ACTN|nr:MAG: hypothetical protein AVDCRST_MAG76-2885 [uncultured Acidimicrobiales bacterium]
MGPRKPLRHRRTAVSWGHDRIKGPGRRSGLVDEVRDSMGAHRAVRVLGTGGSIGGDDGKET